MANFIYQQIAEDACAVTAYTGRDTAVIIPDTYEGMAVVMLSDELFAGHAEISRILLPKTLKYIGSRVFDGCDGLKSLRLPEGLENLAQFAFSGSGLEIIEIPGSIKSIVPFTFKDCSHLNTAVVRIGVKKIYAQAFEGCENLELVAVPSDTEISHEAFTGCVKLNPELSRKLISTCKCPVCTGAAPKITFPAKDRVKDFLKRKTR